MSKIEAFFRGRVRRLAPTTSQVFAVIGASADPSKFGNRIFKEFQTRHRVVYPVNPRGGEIEGAKVYTDLASLPEAADCVSIVTPPAVTNAVIDVGCVPCATTQDAIRARVKSVWMQPGAEHPEAVRKAEAAGIDVIADGSCVLVGMRTHGIH